MVIFRLSGGFGNQLWSFAAAYACAKEQGQILALDTSTQEAAWFFRDYDIGHYDIRFDQKICYRLGDAKLDHLLWNHVYRRAALGLFTPTVKEKDKSVYDPHAFDRSANGYKGRVYYVGDWQHARYFEKYEEDIRKMFVYKEPLSEEAGHIKEEIMYTPNSVAVHVRRGDYVRIGIAQNAGFYRNAVECMAEKLGKDAVFYCFSEDLEWVRDAFKNLPYEFRYMDYESDNKGLEDFELMRCCRHNIISRSSYSWWAARLNINPDKIVVYPRTEHSQDPHTWPASWICLGDEEVK